MNLVQTVEHVGNFFNIPCNLLSYPFNTWSQLDKKRRGVYVITNDSAESADVKYIYVGKGFFRARQKSHWRKLTSGISQGEIDPKGWKWLRENHNLNLEQWKLYLVDLALETQLSAMEGSLIHLLQPLANDETFVDRQKINS